MEHLLDRFRAAWGPAFVSKARRFAPRRLTEHEHILNAQDAGPGRILALVPAHNEEALIGETLHSLAEQTRPVREVIVVADRCTDRTAAVSTAHGARVFETVGNTQAKAGALNQALAALLPGLSDDDAILIMDADGSVAPEFVAQAANRLRYQEDDQAPIGGVGGIFFGHPLKGLVPHLQNNEYVRYAREIERRHARADVLTGTVTLFPVKALRHVQQARAAGMLPEGTEVYDVEALTEDNELTLALKHLGYRCVSPRACLVGTELMPTWSRLFHQRLRWQRGALENLRAYGMTRVTTLYLARQLLMHLSVAFIPFYLTVLLYTVLTQRFPGWLWFWVAVTGVAVFERVWAAKRGGWRSLLLAALIVPEILYDMFLNVVYVKALIDTVTGARRTWERAPPAGSGTRHRRRRELIVVAACTAALLAAVVALALVCAWLGIAWPLIGVFVLCGVAAGALRLSRLYPSGLFLASGEQLHRGDDFTPPARPPGLGGHTARRPTPTKHRTKHRTKHHKAKVG